MSPIRVETWGKPTKRVRIEEKKFQAKKKRRKKNANEDRRRRRWRWSPMTERTERSESARARLAQRDTEPPNLIWNVSGRMCDIPVPCSRTGRMAPVGTTAAAVVMSVTDDVFSELPRCRFVSRWRTKHSNRTRATFPATWLMAGQVHAKVRSSTTFSPLRWRIDSRERPLTELFFTAFTGFAVLGSVTRMGSRLSFVMLLPT